MQKIKVYRERLGMTQEQLARELGITQGAVWQWECGMTTPRPAILLRLASLFGVTIDELIREGDDHADDARA